MKFFRVTILMELLQKSASQIRFSNYSHSYFVKLSKQECFPKTDLNVSWAGTCFNQHLHFIFKLIKLLSNVLVESVFKFMSGSAKTLMFDLKTQFYILLKFLLKEGCSLLPWLLDETLATFRKSIHEFMLIWN